MMWKWGWFLCLSKKCYFNPFHHWLVMQSIWRKMLHFICVSRRKYLCRCISIKWFVIYKNVILSIEYCTSALIAGTVIFFIFILLQEGSFWKRYSGETVYVYSRQETRTCNTLDDAALLLVRCCVRNLIKCVFRRAPVDAQIHSDIL